MRERGGARAGDRRGWRIVRRLLVALLLVGALAASVTTQLELHHSRDRLAAARARAAGARSAQESADRRLTDAAAGLTTAEARAVDAAEAAAAARARLAETGVSEAELRRTLDDTEQQLAAAEEARAALVAELGRLDRLLPDVKTCVADAVRTLAVAALHAAPVLTPTAACRSTTAGLGPR